MESIRIRKEDLKLRDNKGNRDKTLDDFFIDWVFFSCSSYPLYFIKICSLYFKLYPGFGHLIQARRRDMRNNFDGVSDDEIKIIEKCFYNDRYCCFTEQIENVRDYLKENDGYNVFLNYNNDTKRCCHNFCSCGFEYEEISEEELLKSKELILTCLNPYYKNGLVRVKSRAGCQNPFFALSSFRRLI
jgi:hypothetical protein